MRRRSRVALIANSLPIGTNFSDLRFSDFTDFSHSFFNELITVRKVTIDQVLRPTVRPRDSRAGVLLILTNTTRSESTHRAARRSKPSVYRHSFSERVGVDRLTRGTPLFLMTRRTIKAY